MYFTSITRVNKVLYYTYYKKKCILRVSQEFAIRGVRLPMATDAMKDAAGAFFVRVHFPNLQ